MLMSYVAYKKARENNAYDSLMINNDNKIREGTRTNFFYTDGKTIFTAPKEQVLNGVTRITLLEALKKENIAVREKELDLKELKKYKGFFLTSTSSKVVPISEINNKKIEIPEIIKKVIRVYNRYLEEYGKKSKII
jgi:branched-chain amino acid aminotransferase